MTFRGDREAAQRANQRRYEEAEARQLARCEAILAEEALQKAPTTIRCQCGGLIVQGRTQEHHCRFYGVAA